MSFDSMFSAALNKKYSIMQQQADSDSIRAAAARSASIGSGSGSDPFNPLQGLQEQLLAAQIKQARSGTALNLSNASATDDANQRASLGFDQAFNSGEYTVDDKEALKKAKGLKKGTASVPAKGAQKALAGPPGMGMTVVPGKGSGKVDKVPAKLAPGEAVLNKGAAKIAGKGLITALNKLGAQKMGMT